jgi:hypothetical protein
MVAIPTMEEEDARRPSRERESLVNERSRITNRMKSALARLGIRGFKPHLRKAPERLAGLRTAAGGRRRKVTGGQSRRRFANGASPGSQVLAPLELSGSARLRAKPDTWSVGEPMNSMPAASNAARTSDSGPRAASWDTVRQFEALYCSQADPRPLGAA